MSIEVRNNPDLSQPGYYIECLVSRPKIDVGLDSAVVTLVPDMLYVGPFPSLESVLYANECRCEILSVDAAGNVVRVE